MVRVLVILIGVLAASGGTHVAIAQAPEPAVVASADSVRATLDRFCVRCHNDRLRTADLTLDTHDLTDVGADAETWEKVIVKLRARTMPPRGQPATGRGNVPHRRRLAGDGHRHRGPGRSRPRPRRDVPPPEPGRISRRGARPARGRRRRRRAVAGRRHLRARLRQQRRRALDLAGPGGAVPFGGAPDQPSSPWASPPSAPPSRPTGCIPAWCRTSGRTTCCRSARAAASRFGTTSPSTASTRYGSASTGTSRTTSSATRRPRSWTCAWTAPSSSGSRSATPTRWGRWPR